MPKEDKAKQAEVEAALIKAGEAELAEIRSAKAADMVKPE